MRGPIDISALRLDNFNDNRNQDNFDDNKNQINSRKQINSIEHLFKDPLKFLTTAFSTRQVTLTTVSSLLLPSQTEEKSYIFMLSTLTITNPRVYIGRNGVTTLTGFQLPIWVPFPIIIDKDVQIYGITNVNGTVVTILEL